MRILTLIAIDMSIFLTKKGSFTEHTLRLCSENFISNDLQNYC